MLIHFAAGKYVCLKQIFKVGCVGIALFSVAVLRATK